MPAGVARRLTGFDAGFLYQETPAAHMHTLKIAVLDPSGVEGGYSFALMRRIMASRLHLLPPFTRRVVPVPFHLHHPVWVEDPDFDLANHLYQVSVPAPGGDRELGEVISAIAGVPLARNRPLWEIHVAEGLAGGRIACIAKIHHALADGLASAEMLMAVMGDTLELEDLGDLRDLRADSALVVRRAGEPEPIPTSSDLLRQAGGDLRGLLVGLPGQARRSTASLRKARRDKKAAGEGTAAPRVFSGPRTSFNERLDARRIFAFTTLDLGEAKAIRQATGATFNDVVMAICAGAVRGYLAGRGNPVDRALVASVPVSTRTEEQRGTYGNRVSNMFAAVPIHLSDPLARLRLISDVNRVAKEQTQALGRDSFEALTDFTPPWAVRAYANATGRVWTVRGARPPLNLIISNVPGPTETLSIAGAELEAIYSVGPILQGIGLNMTMWSYRDRMHFGLLSCPRLLPDLWDLTDHLHHAMAELSKAAAATLAP